MPVMVTCKFEEDPIQNKLVIDRSPLDIVPIMSQWDLLVAIETTVLI